MLGTNCSSDEFCNKKKGYKCGDMWNAKNGFVGNAQCIKPDDCNNKTTVVDNVEYTEACFPAKGQSGSCYQNEDCTKLNGNNSKCATYD